MNQDRDYWLHAPAATGGKIYYVTNSMCTKSGSPAACCTGNGTGNCLPGHADATLFTAAGANAYYPYTPFTYPHPIRTDCVSYPTLCDAGSPQTCTYAYSSWGACQSTNTQSRTVISSSPSGCTGTPILTQSCTYTPQNFLPEQYIQAESGILTSMQTGTSGSDTYIYTATSNQGSVKFTFDISQAGQYKMEAKINSNNDAGQNSFYVGLDNESAQGNNTFSYSLPLVNVFTWDDVNRVGNGTALPDFDPMTWNLTQGQHSFTFYGRETNTWLDQIILKRVVTDTIPPAAPSGVTVN